MDGDGRRILREGKVMGRDGMGTSGGWVEMGRLTGG